jgi:acyl-CoA reductase-like NAD-dependent aldehyde dehydrogenase
MMTAPVCTDSKLLIGGSFVNAPSERTFDVVNRATEESVAKVADADNGDMTQAIAAARKGLEDTVCPPAAS